MQTYGRQILLTGGINDN